MVDTTCKNLDEEERERIIPLLFSTRGRRSEKVLVRTFKVKGEKREMGSTPK